MIKLIDIVREMKVHEPFFYNKASGESHSYNEYKSNNEKNMSNADKFFVDVNNGKILASFTGWNVPLWASALKSTKDSGYGVYDLYTMINPPPYMGLPGPLNPKDPNNWESNLSKVRSFAKNLDN